jgi:hypothetical protein
MKEEKRKTIGFLGVSKLTVGPATRGFHCPLTALADILPLHDESGHIIGKLFYGLVGYTGDDEAKDDTPVIELPENLKNVCPPASP